MSTKIYNGIKFKTSNIEELLKQLQSLRQQMLKNQLEYFNSDEGVNLIALYCIDTKFDFNTSYGSYELERKIKKDLKSSFVPRWYPDWETSVCIFPLNNILYGTKYVGCQANEELLSTVCDDYYYQDQTDQPEDISDSEWDTRREIWDIIFNEYWTPQEAGFMYTIVNIDDLTIDDNLYNKIKNKIEEFKNKKMTNETLTILIVLMLHFIGTLIWCKYIINKDNSNIDNKIKYIIEEILLGILLGWFRLILETLYGKDR